MGRAERGHACQAQGRNLPLSRFAFPERVRSPGGGYISVPFAADVELSMRTG